jgi:hypothetical protein
MTRLFNFIDKLYLKQWKIGIAKGNINVLFESGLKHTTFKWYPVSKYYHLHADPFILKSKRGEYLVFFEKLCKKEGFGKIFLKTLNHNLEITDIRELLNHGNHLSYPFIFIENDKTYIIPESSEDNNVYLYQFDDVNKKLINPVIIIKNQPLIDCTLLKYKNKYWIFATEKGKNSNCDLHIYYSDQITGPFNKHKLNPVKSNLYGSRSAGKIFTSNNEIFRPSQNCVESYGYSVVINKIIKLSEYEFEESKIIELKPSDIDSRIKGIHTLNTIDDLIIIDGLVKIFSPFFQIKLSLKNLFNRIFTVPYK